MSESPKIEQPVESEPSYEELFKLVEKSDILPKDENQEWSLNDLQLTLTEAFKEAGEQSLKNNDGKIFITLSGGLDSSLALAFLRKIFSDKEIITFTLGGTEAHPDVVHARLAAQKFKSLYQEIIPTPQDIHNTMMKYQEKFPGKDLEKATKSGEFDVYLLYKKMSEHPDKPKTIIAFDGIDELMGGYWQHRDTKTKEQKETFNDFWQRLVPEHLISLTKTASSFDINLIFPYLDRQVIEAISQIPLRDRVDTTGFKGIGKKPMREIAKRLGVPDEIINRPKRGQVGMTEKE